MSTNETSDNLSGAAKSVGQSESAARMLETVQLARLSRQLQDLPKLRSVVSAFGANPDEYASRLAKQHTDLAQKLRNPAFTKANFPSPPIAKALDHLGDIFGWWESVVAPNATVWDTETPSTSQTSGTIGADIYPGYLSLGGQISNSSTQEQWWVNIWQYLVPFPATSSTLKAPASLSYRFNIGANLAFYRQDVATGSVHAYVTVATTSDLAAHPIDYSHIASSQFALIADLPGDQIIGGTAAVTGTIPLTPGGTPAIGILVGLIVSAAQGEVFIIPGEYSSIGLAPPGATSNADLGKVQYRRDPPFWVEAVSQMVNRPAAAREI